MSTFSWLHFTDLHMGAADNQFYMGTVHKNLFNDIDYLENEYKLDWDAVFFTGDLVNEGTDAEFKKFNGWLMRLSDHLKTAGRTNPVFLAVPGNHDLLRYKKENEAFIHFHENWKKDSNIQDAIWHKKETSDSWKLIQGAFRSYTHWWNDPQRPLPKPGGIIDGLLPGDFAYTLNANGLKIGVIGINTTFLQLSGGDYRERLDVHPSQIVALCGEYHHEWFETNNYDFCLLLSHHPVAWFSGRGKEEFENEIAPEGRFLLHLCGHMHENHLNEVSKPFSSIKREVFQSCSLFGQKSYTVWNKKDDSTIEERKRQHGYLAGQIIQTPREMILRIWARTITGNRTFDRDSDRCPRGKEFVEYVIPIIPMKDKPTPAPAPDIRHVNERKIDSGTNESMKPHWADHSGSDNYGQFADFKFEGVTQRMRWIPPGKFMMGSPKDESGRSDNERQHPVKLTHGFWLADTCCTQALWQAVMGENPSWFKGENRPVDTVSWDDCMQFIKQINYLKDGLDLRLPTEAEWEYVCRAQTKTPFSFGTTITPKQVNYNNNNKGTVEVKSMPCNEWGLYQMHGNVWEWCSDGYGDYLSSSDVSVDPSGPTKGGGRVLRGGGWFPYGRLVRSAVRNRLGPGGRDDGIGLRLARGQ